MGQLLLGDVKLHHIVPSRLSAIQKKQLVEGYREGQSTSSLAKMYGCSPNTVSRTVKALLPIEEYNALKQARSKGKGSQVNHHSIAKRENSRDPSENIRPIDKGLDKLESRDFSLDKESDSKEIDNNQDSYDDCISIEENQYLDDKLIEKSEAEDFHEVVPLLGDFDLLDKRSGECLPFSKDLFPESVYLVVDRSVELDLRTLSEFPELGIGQEDDKGKYLICLFENQRSAKRNCARNQRVIKIPDANLFEICRPYLIARGITRLILEGRLISLEDIKE